MTNEQIKAKELAKLLNAFAEGKQLEYNFYPENEWRKIEDVESIIIAIKAGYEIRIKPETKRVPLTKKDMTERIELGDFMWIKNIHSGVIFQIIAIHILEIQVQHGRIAFDTLANNYTFLDGTPCYKEVSYE